MKRKYKDVFRLLYYSSTYHDIFYYLKAPIADSGFELPYEIDPIEFLLRYADDRTLNILPNSLYQMQLDLGLPERDASEAMALKMAKYIYDKFAEKWSRIYSALFATYNPIENYNSEEIRTPNLIKQIKNSGDDKTSLNTDIASEKFKNTFDSGTYKGIEKNETKGNAVNNYSKIDYNSMVKESQTGSDTIIKKGNIGVTTSQQMIESELDLRNKNDFLDMVYDDIASYILSNIF